MYTCFLRLRRGLALILTLMVGSRGEWWAPPAGAATTLIYMYYTRVTLTRFRMLRDDKYNVMNVAMVPIVAMGPSNLSKICFSVSSGFVFHSAIPK